MNDYIKRMNDEYDELNTRANKLADFMEGDVFEKLPIFKKQLMKSQLHAMRAYREILGARIHLER